MIHFHGLFRMLRGAEKLVPVEYWCPYGTRIFTLMLACKNFVSHHHLPLGTVSQGRTVLEQQPVQLWACPPASRVQRQAPSVGWRVHRHGRGCGLQRGPWSWTPAGYRRRWRRVWRRGMQSWDVSRMEDRRHRSRSPPGGILLRCPRRRPTRTAPETQEE